jgi:tetratricopeptide (TPR) repeat protein
VYKDRSVDLRQLGRDLNVRYAVKGSVQREGEQIRITALLIETQSGSHLWSERWDKPAKEFFAIQTDIAYQVGSRLGGIINKAEYEASRRSQPDNLTAYELYLAGHNELRRSTPESNKKAQELLQRAVEADPTLARAWVELAWTHQGSINFGGDLVTEVSAGLAAGQRAVELDPDNAFAHAVVGWMMGMKGDLVRSESEFNKALQLNPGSADILMNYAAWASTFGHPERAAEAADRAIRLNPSYHVGAAYSFQYAYFMSGRYEDALRILEALPVENYNYYCWVVRAASYAALGRSEAAKLATIDALNRYPDLTIEGFTGTPDYSDADRLRLIEPMRAAGFPVCVKPETLARSPQLVRLPECLSR